LKRKYTWTVSVLKRDFMLENLEWPVQYSDSSGFMLLVHNPCDLSRKYPWLFISTVMYNFTCKIRTCRAVVACMVPTNFLISDSKDAIIL